MQKAASFAGNDLSESNTGLIVVFSRVAGEQKARVTYDNILRLVDDPDVRDVIKFLREREIVHFQRFGEALRLSQERLDSKNFYAFNPGFDKKKV